MATDISIAEVSWEQHAEQLGQIREVVFVLEQHVPREIEWDGADTGCRHFLATDAQGKTIGCSRLMPDGQIGRMAVLREHRSKGIGALLLEAAVASARSVGMTQVYLHAQTHALEFYQKNGFAVTGEEFVEAGIPHVNMIQKLVGQA